MRKISTINKITYYFIALSFLAVYHHGTVYAQIPTVNIPTVTGTDTGVVITVNNDPVNPQINVRSGPGTEYDRVGTLLANQKVIGKGRTEGGSWLLIDFPGGPGGEAWVYKNYVSYVGDLRIVGIPPTPTPRVTNTIDPTLAAQFIISLEPTRMATFTAPPELDIPQYEEIAGTDGSTSMPMGLVIAACGILGVIIGLFSLAQRK